MIDFTELAKTTVHIGIGGGKYIEVPMLSVGDYAQFQGWQKDLMQLNAAKDTTEAQRIDAIIAARAKMAALAAKVMPAEMAANLGRMDYAKLAALIVVLCTGNDDGEKDDPQKKITLPSQLQNQPGK